MPSQITPSVKIDIQGARGESQADILRRTGRYGVLPNDTDDQVMGKLNAAAEQARDDAQNARDGAIAGSNYRPTISQGVADFAVGEFFTSDDQDEEADHPFLMRTYKRISESPYYVDMGDSAAPLTKPELATDDGSSLVGAPIAGTVADRLQWVTPEAFGAVGDGTNADADTSGLQAAVNTGLPVKLRPNANYIINDEIMPPVGVNLTISGYSNTGVQRSTLTAAAGFTGWMLRPRAGYDLRDLRLIGNYTDGCYLIGSPDTSSTGLARIERTYMSDADLGIYFGSEWQHPWGLYYNQIVGTNFRTGGICLAGVSGAPSSLSGESAWTMDNINLIGSSAAGPSGTGGISAPDVTVSHNNPDATHDTISWTNTSVPLYGWCVMRSANGTTGWHVVPNWTSPLFTAGSFTALKGSGETWFYAVVRMTRGLSIRRGKAITAGVVQAEYFGVGLYYEGISMLVGQFYSESRDRNPPLPSFSGILGQNGNITINGGWIENAGWGIVSSNNSRMNVMGPFRMHDCKWGKTSQGGATSQSIRHYGDIIASGTTPNTMGSLSGGANDYLRAGVDQDSTLGSMTNYVDGFGGSGFSARRRGVEVARMYANPAGEGQIDVSRVKALQPSKTALVPFSSKQATVLTPGTATDFMTISGVPANTTTGFSVFVLIAGFDGSSTSRQSCVCRLDVAIVEAAGSGVTAAVAASTPAQAIQQGTMGIPTFTASVASGVVTLACNIASSQSSLRLYATPIVGGGEAQTVTITQL